MTTVRHPNGTRPRDNAVQRGPADRLTKPTTADKPAVLPPIFENIPRELAASPRWVLWKLQLVKGEWTKPPYQDTRRRASTTDPLTWRVLAMVATEYRKTGGRSYSGVGWVVGDGIVGVDIDHCRDPITGELTPEAQDAVDRLNTYTEPSPSGTGIRLFALGELPTEGRKRGDYEAYDGDGGRYLTVTGHHLPGTPSTIEHRTLELAEFHALHIAAPRKTVTTTPKAALSVTLNLSDDKVLDAALTSRNGAAIRALFEGDTSAHGGDHSAADLGLAGSLAWFADYDMAQVDRLFRRSQLMRAKWDDQRGTNTYGHMTLTKAAEGNRPGDGYRLHESHESGPTLSSYVASRTEGEEDALLIEEDSKERKSAAAVLTEMALDLFTLGVSPEREYFAVPKSGPKVVRSLRGRDSLRAQLAKLYWEKTHRAPPAQALADALAILEGYAEAEEPQTLFQRVAERPGELWLDVGDTTGRAVKITAEGWSVQSFAPMLFRRTAATGALPIPVTGGNLSELWQWLNIPPEDRPLVLAYLVAALKPNIPHTILGLFGERGSGKSSAARAFARVLDPGPALTSKPPKDADAWITAASSRWLVVIDNVTVVPDWLSDALCRGVTGEGDIRRRLFTDGDLFVYAFRRVIVVTAIDLGALNGDLADRMLPVTLPVIEEGDRLKEEDMAAKWDAAHPRILGALLDLTAKVQTALPSVKPPKLPRMADFAEIVAAVDHVLGTQGFDRFMGSQDRMAADSLTGDSFVSQIMTSIARPFEGTSAELLALVTPNTDGWRRPKDWPGNARAVTQRLHKQAPVLRQVGWHVSNDGGKNIRNAIRWTITPPGPEEVGISDSSNSSDSSTGERADQHGNISTSHEPLLTPQDESDELSPSPVTRLSSLPQSRDELETSDLDSSTRLDSSLTRVKTPVQDGTTSLTSQTSMKTVLPLDKRAAELVDELVTLTVEQLFDRYATALPHAANAPTWWPNNARTEPVAVTAALVILAEDEITGDFRLGSQAQYLTAARAAVKATA